MESPLERIKYENAFAFLYYFSHLKKNMKEHHQEGKHAVTRFRLGSSEGGNTF